MQSYIITTALAVGFAVTTTFGQSAFQWLEGTWKQQNKPAYEVWKKGTGEVLFDGLAFKILASGDTVITEEIKFIKDGKSSFAYVPDVAGNQGPVRFELTKFTRSGFVAENPGHDFPKKITYTWYKKEKRMLATISGDGKSIDFHFEKVIPPKD